MNLDLPWWGRLAGLLTAEATLVVAAAWLAARWLRSPQLQRAVWQAALLGVALLWMSELGGARGQLAKLRPAKPPARTLSVRLQDPPPVRIPVEDFTEPFPTEELSSALPIVPPPPPSPVWWPGWLWLGGLMLLIGRLVVAHAGLAWRSWRSHGQDRSAGRRASVLECVRLAAAFIHRALSRSSTTLAQPAKAETSLRSASALQDADALTPAISDPSAATTADAQATVESLRRPLGLRRVRVLVWAHLRGPVAFGVLRPTVALPMDFTERFSPAQREAMLAHELAHLAARDPLWLALADLVCALAWWHPAVWLARRQLRSACEAAADEAAALAPDGRAALAESLVTFGRELASPRWTRGIGVAGDGLKSQLARRVKALLRGSGEWRAVRASRLWMTRGAAVLATAALLALPWPGTGGPAFTDVLRTVAASAQTTEKSEAWHPVRTTVPASERPPEGSPAETSSIWQRAEEVSSPSGFGYELDLPGTFTYTVSFPGKPVAGSSPKSVYVALRDPVADPASSNGASGEDPLSVYLFQVPAVEFREQLKRYLPSGETNLNVAVRAFCAANGVQVPTPATDTGRDFPLLPEGPKVAAFVDAYEALVLNGTQDDADRIGLAIQSLHLPPVVTPSNLPEPQKLRYRRFRLPTAAFRERLQAYLPFGQTDLQSAVREFCADNGLELAPPPGPIMVNGALPFPLPGTDRRTASFNDRTGILSVHATGEELDRIERALKALNLPPVPKPAEATGQSSNSQTNRLGPRAPLDMSVLEKIVLPSFELKGEKLADVVGRLETAARAADPEGRGVSFGFAPGQRVDPAKDGAAGIGAVLIKSAPTMHQIKLSEVISAILSRADKEIAAAVDPEGVIFVSPPPRPAAAPSVAPPSNGPPEVAATSSKSIYTALRDPLAEPSAARHATDGSALFTRRYKVEPATFLAGLALVLGLDQAAPATTNRPAQVQQDVRRFFWAAGVAFPEPTAQPTATDLARAFFFNDRTGDLFVRATATDLDVIDRAVQALAPATTTEISDPAMPKAKANDERVLKALKLPPEPNPDVTAQPPSTDAESDTFNSRLQAALREAKQADLDAKPIIARYGFDSPQGTQAVERYRKAKEKADAFERVLAADKELESLRTRYKDRHPKVVAALAARAELLAKLQDLPSEPAAPTTPAPSAPSANPARQVVLETQFAEVTERGTDDLGLDWLFGQSPTNNPAVQSGPATNLLTEPNVPQSANVRVDLLRIDGQSATLTEAQFAALRKRLEGRGGVDFMAAPKVVTESGRQARVSVSEEKTIVSGAEATPGTATNQAGINYQTEKVALGPTVDIIPAFEGADARLGIVATVTEFLGYDQPKPGQEVTSPAPGDKTVKGVVPLPRLRVRAIHADSLAKPGETVVLRGPLVSDTVQFKDKVPVLGDIPLLGRLFRSEGKSTVRKRLYVFVTPTEVTATGEKKVAVPANVLTVSVTAAAPQFHFGDQAVGESELAGRLKAALSADPELVLRIQSATDVPYANVAALIEAVRNAGITRFDLATEAAIGENR